MSRLNLNLNLNQRNEVFESCSIFSEMIRAKIDENLPIYSFFDPENQNIPDSPKSGTSRGFRHSEAVQWLKNLFLTDKTYCLVVEWPLYSTDIKFDKIKDRIMVTDFNLDVFGYCDHENIEDFEKRIQDVTYYRPAHLVAKGHLFRDRAKKLVVSKTDLQVLVANRAVSIAPIFDAEALAVVDFRKQLSVSVII